MHFVVYLYIMDLITKCISKKQTHMHVSFVCVNVFVMRQCVCDRIQVQLKGLNECQFFLNMPADSEL